MRSDSNKAFRIYLVSCIILGISLVSLWLVVCFYSSINIVLLLVLLPALLITSKVVVLLIAKKTLLPILFEKLDSFEFQKIANHNLFAPNLTFRTSAAISVGDYQTVVDIANDQLINKKIPIKIKYYYLCILARAYFELRDFEKLEVVLSKYEEYKEQYPSKSFFRMRDSMWIYYQYFLGQNYEACRVAFNNQKTKSRRESSGKNYYDTLNDFYCAVACYSNNDFEKAKELFEDIISSAPKLHLSKVSQKYIEAIKSGSQLGIFDEVIPQENYRVFDSNKLKKTRRNRIIIGAVCTIFAFVMIVSYSMDTKNKEYEKNLNNALSQHYDQAEFIKYFNVKANGQHIDALCIVNTISDA